MNRRRFLEVLTVAGAGVATGAVRVPIRALQAQTAVGPLPPRFPWLGINTHTLRPEEVAHVRALGITLVRVPGILQRWEKERFFRDSMRDMSSKASDAGLALLWYLHNVPEGHSAPAPLRDRRGWMRRMTAFADWTARLPATEAVQLWNEPDAWVQAPFGFAQRIDARDAGALYAEQLEMAAPVVRSAARGVRVVASGVAQHPEHRAPEFLRGMSQSRPPVDAFALHAYGPWSGVRERILEARRIVGESTPVWVTEFGNDQVNGSRFDPARHFESWRSVVEGNRRERLAERMYGYTLQTDPRPEFSQHGLFETDGTTPRRIYHWLRERVNG
jgi:hypothetical protein